MRRILPVLLLTIYLGLTGAQAPQHIDCEAPGLRAALELAVTAPTMQRAYLAVVAAKHEEAAAGATFSGTASFGVNTNVRTASTEISVPLDASITWTGLDVGPAAETRQLAAATLRDAEADYFATWSRTVISVTKAYLAVLYANDDLELAEIEASLARQRAIAIAELLEGGAVRVRDLASAELEAQQAELRVLERQLGAQETLAELGRQIGCDPTRVVQLEPNALTPLLANELQASAADPIEPGPVASATMTAAEVTLTRAERDAGVMVEASMSGRLTGPAGELSVDMSMDNRRLAPTATVRYLPIGGTANSNAMSVGVAIRVPLGAVTASTTAAAIARIESTTLTQDAAQNEAQRRVKAAVAFLELAHRRAELATTVVEHRRLDLEDIYDRHRLGLVTQAHVQQAHLDLGRAELEARRAENATIVARLELDVANGYVPALALLQLEEDK